MRAVRSVADAQALLKRGFTSVRDISWNGLYLKRVFREGSLPGPRVIACGPGLCRTGGHGDAFQYEEDYVVRNHFWAVLADGPDEIRKAVRRLLREGADQIKVWASGGDNWANDRNRDQHYTLEELQRRRGRGAHAEGHAGLLARREPASPPATPSTAGADTIEHGEELDEALCEEMAARGVILVPTLELLVTWFTDFAATADAPIEHLRPQVFLHRDVDDTPDADFGQRYARRVIDNFRMAKEKGVKIALGSDTVFTPLTPYGEYSAREFKALAAHGMTTLEAITAATHTAAEALGMAHRLGSIEPGKAADLLVVTKGSRPPTRGALRRRQHPLGDRQRQAGRRARAVSPTEPTARVRRPRLPSCVRARCTARPRRSKAYSSSTAAGSRATWSARPSTADSTRPAVASSRRRTCGSSGRLTPQACSVTSRYHSYSLAMRDRSSGSRRACGAIWKKAR